MVQRLVDPDRSEADRAVHLRLVLEPRAHPVVLPVAALGWRDLVRRGFRRAARAAWVIRFRLGIGACLYVPDQPLRPVRSASGLAVPAGTIRSDRAVRDSWTIPPCATPALRRLALRILDDASDDARTSALLGRYDSLHIVGDPVRGTRPGPRTRGCLRSVPPIRAYARPLHR